MEIAGAGAFTLARDLLVARKRVVVACGPGQNGGDGFVVARYARSAGHDVTVFAIRAPAPGTASGRQYERLAAFEIAAPSTDLDSFRRALEEPGVIVVDALFGTGLAFPLRPDASLWIATLASGGLPVVSIDLPSGLDGDSGESPGGCVRAIRTLTIGALKPGLLTPAGAQAAGDVKVVPLPYPPRLTRGLTTAGGC